VKKAVALLLAANTYKSLEAVFAMVCAGSPGMCRVAVKDSLALRTKFNFSPAPGVRPFALRYAKILDDYLNVPSDLLTGAKAGKLSMKDPVKFDAGDSINQCSRLGCMQSVQCVVCSCGLAVCYPCYAFLMNQGRQFEPPHCVCGLPMRVTSPVGKVAFHEAWVTGHTIAGAANLAKHMLQPQMIPNYTDEDFELLSQCITVAHENSVFDVEDGTFAIPHFLEPNHMVREFPSTGPGLFYDMPPGVKKDVLLGKVVAYILNIAEVISHLEYDAAMTVLRSTISAVMQISVKLEVRAPKWNEVLQKWVIKNGERFFFIGNAINCAIDQMLLMPFSKMGGIGTTYNNVPNKVGMTFCGLSAMKFVSESYQIPEITLSSMKTRDDVEKLIKEIIRIWITIELDVEKYDIYTLGFIISAVKRSFGKYFNLSVPSGDDAESQLRRANVRVFKYFFMRSVETVTLKTISDPAGNFFYMLVQAMVSGTWDTSFINTIINDVAQTFTLKKMYPEIPIVRNAPATSQVMHTPVTKMLYGDDVLMNLRREIYPKFDKELYRKIIKEKFNYNVPENDIKECSMPFIDIYAVGTPEREGNAPDPTVPTFLKYQVGWLYCVDCKFIHFHFYRHSSHTIPKLLHSSTSSLEPGHLRSRLICYAYTVGVNRVTYNALKCLWLQTEKDEFVEVDWSPENLRRMEVYGMDIDKFDRNKFPRYVDVVGHSGCPNYGVGIKVRTVLPWPMCKYD